MIVVLRGHGLERYVFVERARSYSAVEDLCSEMHRGLTVDTLAITWTSLND